MIEDIVFSHLLNNEEYARKVIPFLKTEYFQTRTNKVLFELINNYITEYNRIPSREAMAAKLESLNNLSEDEFTGCGSFLANLEYDSATSVDWLIDETEKFCQERAVYNAIMDYIKIIDKKDPKRNKGSIPEILQEALAVSFDTNIGHDFIGDADARFDFYHLQEEKLARI